ncbi:MAG: hypothetical protein K9L78_02440 [Victivallales bacterium]|nr:hypothetical protein [Victivallales bacterium]MCF7888954.1 hypothetical protein [Victivallales bacterium]
MKSAYERALERSGVKEVTKLTEEQKKQISEIEKKYKAKKIEANIAAQNKIQKNSGDISEVEQIKSDLTVELASLDSKMEQEKEKIRKG